MRFGKMILSTCASGGLSTDAAPGGETALIRTDHRPDRCPRLLVGFAPLPMCAVCAVLTGVSCAAIANQISATVRRSGSPQAVVHSNPAARPRRSCRIGVDRQVQNYMASSGQKSASMTALAPRQHLP
jgi:hypothetical protein